MIHYIDDNGQLMKVTHEMPLRLGLVALLVLDSNNPRKLAPDQHWDAEEGHFVSRMQNGPNNDKGACSN